MAGGTGSCTLVETAPGGYTFTATSGGDTNFSGSSSSASATVTQGASATATSTDLEHLRLGPTVTITATVSAVSPATGTPTGTVSVSDGTRALHHHLGRRHRVVHLGRDRPGRLRLHRHLRRGHQLQRLVLERRRDGHPGRQRHGHLDGPRRTYVSGQTVTITATVSAVSPATGTPTGTVSVSDGTQAAPSPWPAAPARAPWSRPPRRLHLRHLRRGHQLQRLVSSAGATVDPGRQRHRHLDGPRRTYVSGQTVTITATVTPSRRPRAPRRGTVSVSDGTQRCTITLAGGTGSCTLVETAPGGYTFTATYGGDTNFSGSSSSASATVTQGASATATSTDLDAPTSRARR